MPQTIKFPLDAPFPTMNTEPGQKLYLLVDGGQIEQLAQSLYQVPDLKTPEPIYMRPPFDGLKAVSPYLVEATEPVRQWFMAQNKPTAGFFFTSAWPQLSLSDYLRHLIQIISPYGSEIYLKMAHSEVAWVLLSSASQLFWHPLEQAWLPTRMGWQHLTRPEFQSALPDFPLKLDDKQWTGLGEISERNARERLYHHMETYFPRSLQEQPEPTIWLNSLIEQGKTLGFESEQEQLLYLNIIGYLGESAINDEQQYPDIRQLIHQPSQQTPEQRLERAAGLAQQYSHSLQEQTQS
ncbi:DUF4123 domain-containing protein [Vibrio spartinae]|uniref:DUF4123 domain-containing protein n=1 Tax=Vibrio spartinae TaxID=1918945 RepID=A0ABX6QUF8_9VIBR|nr:DUF4123 domain-containing protein [Vibrio spartinae]QMV12834.1 hypothetical protein Vspart_00026 [Vibrio spartinae]